MAGRPLSGWWRRVAAQLIDWLILTIPVIVLTIVIVAIAAGSEAGAVVTGIIAFLAYVVAALFYAPVLMKRPGPRNGQTWGKQAMSITVIRDTGEEIGLGYGFLREIVIKQLLFGFVGGLLLLDSHDRELPVAAVGRPEPSSPRHAREEPRGQDRLLSRGSQAAVGPSRSAASVQIISSRPGPTPIITTGTPRNSEM